MVMDDDGVDWDALYGAMRENGLESEDAAGRVGPVEGNAAEGPEARESDAAGEPDLPFGAGMFSLFVAVIPERGEGGRPATVRGMVWRTVLLLAWYVGVYVANIWYYLTGHGMYEHADLAILSWFGVRFHNTWMGPWAGPLVSLAVGLFSIVAMLDVSILMTVGPPKRKCRLFCLLIALLMPVWPAGALTEYVLDYVERGADFPGRYPNIVPGLILSVVGVALVAGFTFWGVVQNRKGDGGKSRLARRLAVLSPGVPLLGMLAFEGLSGLGKAVASFGMVMLLAAVFVPGDLDGARWVVEHDRGAYWLWPAAIAVVSEFFLCVFGMVTIIYGL